MDESSRERAVEALSTFEALALVLWSDAEEALTAAIESPSDSRRRAAFRAVFASVEGATSALKHEVMELWPKKRRLYSDAEAALLREETFGLSHSGEAESRPRTLPPDLNFRFAMAMFMKELPVGLELDVSGQGWRAFKSSLAVRNRVTHPRVVEDIVVSGSEVETLRVAYNFIKATIVSNIVRALLEFRRLEYRTWDSTLPSDAREWLDSFFRNFAEMNDEAAVGEFSMGDFSGSPAALEALMKAGIVRVDGGATFLTRAGLDYCKWRIARQHEGD